MIKIAYIISSLRNCGPVNQLSYIINNLDNKFEKIIITLKKENKNSLINKFKDVKISRAKNFFEITKILKENKVDIIHTTGIMPDFYGMVLSTKYKVITTIRNYPFDDYPAKFGLIGIFLSIFHLYVIKNIKNRVSCSEFIKNKLLKHNIQTDLIENGIDFSIINMNEKNDFTLPENQGNFILNDFTPEKNQNESVFSNFHLKKEKTFLYVGSIIKRKNIDFMIKGFLIFNKNYGKNNFSLLIVGGGKLLKSLKKKYNKEKTVIFVSHSNYPYYFYKKAGYLISCSKSEGLPNVVLEGLIFGLPIILSDIEAHKVFTDCKQILFYKNGNLSDYVKTLQKIVENPPEIDKKYIEKFNSKVMTKKYEKIYLKLTK